MPDKAESIIQRIGEAFKDVNGIDAVVLGGSRATGTAHEGSDIDIGIYYDAASFDLLSFRENAVSLDDKHREDAVTKLGEWGPWINGGGWLTIGGMAVDLLFKDTIKVIRVIDECIDGCVTIDYQCGHPFGYVNAIYMGEVAYCKVLSSCNDIIEQQKERLSEFPQRYRKAVLERFLWEGGFSQFCGRKAIDKADILYAAGSLFRSAMCLLQVLYAVNGMYMLNEKGSLQRLLKQESAYIPQNFVMDIEAAISGLTKDTIEACFDAIQSQYDQIALYCENLIL